MTFYIFDRNDKFLYRRSDAISMVEYCEDFAFEGAFPLTTEAAVAHPLEAGMRIGWKDDDDAWIIHEIVTAEPGVLGDQVELTGVHIALAELRDTLVDSLKYKNTALKTVVNKCLNGTGWSLGQTPEDDKSVYKLTAAATARSGPGTKYKALKTYKKGKEVNLIDNTTSSSWWKVECPDGRIAWIQSSRLTSKGTSAGVSVPIDMEETWITSWEGLETAVSKGQLLLSPRVEISSSGTWVRKIDILGLTPEYRGIRLTCNTNIVEGGVKYDTSQLYTAMVGIGDNDLTFANVTWTKAGGYPVNKPSGQKYVEIPEATAAYGRSGRRRTGVAHFDGESDAATLLRKTYDQLVVSSVPRVEIDAEVADLYRMGYGGQSMRLYDAVQVILQPLGIRLQAYIKGLQRDLLEPEKTRPTIGTSLKTDIVNDVLAAASAANNVTEWQVRSINGGSLIAGSINSTVLADGCVTSDKLATAVQTAISGAASAASSASSAAAAAQSTAEAAASAASALDTRVTTLEGREKRGSVSVSASSTGTLKSLGIVTEAGIYRISLAYQATTADAGSEYLFRCSGTGFATFTRLAVIAEGTDARAPRLSSSGVLTLNTQADAGTVRYYMVKIY